MKTLVWNTLPTHVAIEALYSADDARVDSVYKALPLPPLGAPDTLASGPTWEVGIATLRGATEWLTTTEAVWTAWTGPRRRDGEEWHGPVYGMDGSGLYDGPRACPCGACQGTAKPELRYS